MAEKTTSDQPAKPLPVFPASDRIEWVRRDAEALVIELYHAIDKTADDQPVDRLLAEAYQQIARASLALTDARRQIVTFERNAAELAESVGATKPDTLGGLVEMVAEIKRQREIDAAELAAMADADAYDAARRAGTAVAIVIPDDDQPSASDQIAARADVIIAGARQPAESDDGYDYVADDLAFDAARERASR